ncbi:probable LRR receptor-like serine/threonine-protein kinase At1g63430 isoform X1 [Rhododendron vialii]|uniref:probable LRR receptor-like serine/threonine-protein kinase At1g63430 isoform X1 n=1 Tax=Rhododendron vialii TaxID=182163 RepID=UPI00265E529A|nr:probable LRR receptor-like serine/threonine-protein kinase At1g63430 isoform X1 [Rhododendron vialii]
MSEKMRPFGSLQLVWVCLGLFLATCEASPSNEVYALNAFKEAIYEDPLLAMSNWNVLDADPCDWNGISCSIARNHVLKLNISGSALRGFLAPELGLLSALQELILHGNNLIGAIPKEFGKLNYLQVLDLGMNQLVGPIPPELGNCTSLMTLNLESNVLTGELPPELGNLNYLDELRLDRNKLQGAIPGNNNSASNSSIYGMSASSWEPTGFCRSSQLMFANFSYNFFVGSIPKCLENISGLSFQGNCLDDKDPTQRPTAKCAYAQLTKTHSGVNPDHRPAQNGNKHEAASRPAWLLALEIVTGTMVGALFLVALLTAVRRCKSKPSILIPWKKSASSKDHVTIYIDSEMLKDVVRFNRQELEVACEDFSNIIGSSPDSLVYKGTLKEGPEIAVISLGIKEEHWTGYLELYFQREVADLSRLDHENAGKLLGYCRESNPFTRMLVFEYASNGTLYEHLHYGEGCQLSWTRRMKIVIGIAQGLRYFHTELDPPFTISALNSSAVYLTDEFSPKLVDFESWKSIHSRSEKNAGSIGNQGAVCVLPNSLEERHLDVQGNIYGFGVLLLEIVSGRPSYCKDKGCLVDWAKDFLEIPEVMSYVVDPELKHFKYDELQTICEAVILCINPNPSKRASMAELCTMLESRIDTSVSAELKASSLAWAELALSSSN